MENLEDVFKDFEKEISRKFFIGLIIWNLFAYTAILYDSINNKQKTAIEYHESFNKTKATERTKSWLEFYQTEKLKNY